MCFRIVPTLKALWPWSFRGPRLFIESSLYRALPLLLPVAESSGWWLKKAFLGKDLSTHGPFYIATTISIVRKEALEMASIPPVGFQLDRFPRVSGQLAGWRKVPRRPNARRIGRFGGRRRTTFYRDSMGNDDARRRHRDAQKLRANRGAKSIP